MALLQERFEQIEEQRREQQERHEDKLRQSNPDYEPDPEPEPVYMPEPYVWLQWLEYRGWTEGDLRRMSIREVWVGWLVYRLERAYGMLAKQL